MLKHRHIDTICIVAMALAVVIILLFVQGERLGLERATSEPAYTAFFDQSRVHTVDLELDPKDWQKLLDDPGAEEYVDCTVYMDGEKFAHTGLRAKGNNSLRLTERYGSDRYSLKLEFDHYSEGGTYYGLDKLSLGASFQDNAMMKDWLTFDMMNYMGVATPLCSYAWVKVNGQDWGLFLATEEPEEAFARRNYGTQFGKLYKPDYKRIDDPNNDVALIYTDDAFSSYDNIFRNAKFDVSARDKARLISALKTLSTGENLDSAVDVEAVLRYFTVQVFVVNLDSYLGPTGHNYFLYEEDGVLTMLPWDYNLAFATYTLGMPNPVNDARKFINYPINTPGEREVMLRRPLYHKLMGVNEYYARYHELFDQLISGYFESGHFQQRIEETAALIAPYVEKDPSNFCSYEDHLLAVDSLERFCLLRAESVRGQLNGTIPSTIRTQAEDNSAFVDTSGLWIPDLGELVDME